MKTIANIASITYYSDTTQITTYSNMVQTIIKTPNNNCKRVYYIICDNNCCCNCCPCCHCYNLNNCYNKFYYN